MHAIGDLHRQLFGLEGGVLGVGEQHRRAVDRHVGQCPYGDEGSLPRIDGRVLLRAVVDPHVGRVVVGHLLHSRRRRLSHGDRVGRRHRVPRLDPVGHVLHQPVAALSHQATTIAMHPLVGLLQLDDLIDHPPVGRRIQDADLSRDRSAERGLNVRCRMRQNGNVAGLDLQNRRSRAERNIRHREQSPPSRRHEALGTRQRIHAQHQDHRQQCVRQLGQRVPVDRIVDVHLLQVHRRPAFHGLDNHRRDRTTRLLQVDQRE